MNRVKGALLKLYIKGIRANKSGIYENMLSEEDMEIVNQRILDGAWYSFETFKKCFNAVTQVYAKNDKKIVKKMGYNAGKETIKRLYRGPMMKRDLSDAIKSYNNLFRLWFDFGKLSLKTLILILNFFIMLLRVGWKVSLMVTLEPRSQQRSSKNHGKGQKELPLKSHGN